MNRMFLEPWIWLCCRHNQVITGKMFPGGFLGPEKSSDKREFWLENYMFNYIEAFCGLSETSVPFVRILKNKNCLKAIHKSWDDEM